MNASWKHPIFLLVSVGIANLGAWVYFIALNLIVFQMTQSPLAVSILYLLLPISALMTHVWSGSLVDRFDQRKLMLALDIARAGLVFLLSTLDSLYAMYALVFFLNVGNTVYESASVVYMTKLVPKANRQRFNALRNFVQSCGFILGPSIAGLLFLIGTPTFAIQLNALALIVSAVFMWRLPSKANDHAPSVETRGWRLVVNDWRETLGFASCHRYIVLVYACYGLVVVMMSGLDALEVSFATETLRLSESRYGFLVSIAGAGIVAGSLLNVVFSRHLGWRFLIAFGVLVTPLGYLVFSVSTSFLVAAIGFFLLTFALSFANTGFLSFYQRNVPTEWMGRFSGVVHVFQSILVIVVTLASGLLAEVTSLRLTYVTGSLLFFGLGLLITTLVMRRDHAHLYTDQQDEFENVS